MRRALTVSGIALLVTFAQTLPALAEDLGEYLERAAAAEYSGEVFIVCDTPDGTIAQFVEVTRSGDELWVRTSGSEAVAANGELYQRGADGTVQATRIDSSAAWEVSPRYTARDAGRARELERPVRVVTVMEGEFERVMLHFDDATGALLRSEVRNGDRSLYCSSSFVSFSAEPQAIDTSVRQGTPESAKVVDFSTIDEEVLPARVGGFNRLDVYEGPESSTVAYYSDGVFSFTVIASRKTVTIPELEDAPVAEVAGEKYRRLFQPGQVVFAWESRVGGYALIGDLPLDLQEAVLRDLPIPGRPGFFTRLWRSWFG
ncbi:MAG: hypothetical protein OEM84_03695 [Acidimicrobiia bacterium]|nr:hypothetical protein [Acidimicrobiia bacterium]